LNEEERNQYLFDHNICGSSDFYMIHLPIKIARFFNTAKLKNTQGFGCQ
jgi:hypothetical protein